jgi:hypothetical protein
MTTTIQMKDVAAVNTITEETPTGRIIVRMEKRDIDRARRIAARYGCRVAKARGRNGKGHLTFDELADKYVTVTSDPNRGGLRLIHEDSDHIIGGIDYDMSLADIIAYFKNQELGDYYGAPCVEDDGFSESTVRGKAASQGYQIIHRRNGGYSVFRREPMTLEEINELCDKRTLV